MSDLLRLSNVYAPTLKEVPTEAEIASHRLLLRAGMLRKQATGLYAWLPLGYRVIQKIENIVREEMNAIGSQEILMPFVQPAELWEESGRWEKYGPELLRLEDRHGHAYCLGPTHEELITALVRSELRSYKELPCSLYQIQVKFRDEIRPRFGVMRSREFIMKDAYSFHATHESLQETYDDMSEAYGKICDRCGLVWRPVEADSGQIGGKVTCEFMALADAGEAEIVHCACGYAADVEAGRGVAHPLEQGAEELEKISTPNIHTIEDLANFLNIPEAATVKALSAKDGAGNLVVLFIPGDHELNEIKAMGAIKGFELLTDEEMLAFGLHKGSMGPVGLPKSAKIYADESLKSVDRWVVGANEEGFHFVGAAPGRDFEVDEWADLVVVKPGDGCPQCGKPLEGARGIEVSQVFQLGDTYSKALGATFMDEDGKEKPFIMGCYGVGVSRTLAAIVEQHNDEHGIIWPASVAPAEVCVVVLAKAGSEDARTAERLAEELAEAGIEVVLDDRDERAGVKFADADLIGWPVQVVVGSRGLAKGTVEIKKRATGEKTEVAIDALVPETKAILATC